MEKDLTYTSMAVSAINAMSEVTVENYVPDVIRAGMT
jgi:hypothetical protein